MTIREQIAACNTTFALEVLYKNLELLEEKHQDGHINYVDFKIQELDILNDIASLIYNDKEDDNSWIYNYEFPE